LTTPDNPNLLDIKLENYCLWGQNNGISVNIELYEGSTSPEDMFYSTTLESSGIRIENDILSQGTTILIRAYYTDHISLLEYTANTDINIVTTGALGYGESITITVTEWNP